MIITRSPLRITLGGGGTDLPSYYRKHGGYLIAAGIDKYVFVSVMKSFAPGIHLKYSEIENVARAKDVAHPIIREALLMMGYDDPQLDIVSLADIPAGTGLGSSGSFTTALIYALYAHERSFISKHELARLACEIEIDRLGDPVGKQDQYVAAYGGLVGVWFNQDDSVVVSPLRVIRETLWDLEDNLLLFFTGYSHRAGAVLQMQVDETESGNQAMLDNLHEIKSLGFASKQALEKGNVAMLGEIMHQHWGLKRKRSVGMSNSLIDEWYEVARANGAVGGKIVGAGGGGFMLLYAEDRAKLRRAMSNIGLEECRFRLDYEGTKEIWT